MRFFLNLLFILTLFFIFFKPCYVVFNTTYNNTKHSVRKAFTQNIHIPFSADFVYTISISHDTGTQDTITGVRSLDDRITDYIHEKFYESPAGSGYL